MHGCTHLSRFALVSRVFPGRYAKKYTGYCIIACVPMWKRYRVLIEYPGGGVTCPLGGGKFQRGFKVNDRDYMHY